MRCIITTSITLSLACGFVSEGLPVLEESSSSSEGGTLPETITPTSAVTSDPSVSSSTSEPDVTTGASGTTTTGESSSEGSESGSSDGGSESTGDEESSSTGDVPCDDQDDCEPGQQCDPTLGYICVWPYDDHHCDESCAPEDKLEFDWGGTPTCYCAKPCVIEADCDADQVCNPLIDRCVLSCANGSNTCPMWTDPTMICALVEEEPPYVQMCLWMNEP